MRRRQTVFKAAAMGFILLAGWVLAVPAWAEIDAAKKRDIQTLMEVSGTIEGLKQFRPMMLQSYANILKAAYKNQNIPKEFWDDFLNTLITDDDLGGLIEEILPVYDRTFTHEEIRELIATFQTPAYRKWVQRMPEMMRASSEAGRQWGKRLGESGVIRQRLQALKEKYQLGEPEMGDAVEDRVPQGR